MSAGTAVTNSSPLAEVSGLQGCAHLRYRVVDRNVFSAARGAEISSGNSSPNGRLTATAVTTAQV